MNAKEARRQMKQADDKEAAEARKREREHARWETIAIANAGKTAQDKFDKDIVPKIKQALKDKQSYIIENVYPESRVGKAELKALQRLLEDEDYTYDEPKWFENKGHDPDWGHYDMSCWLMYIRW